MKLETEISSMKWFKRKSGFFSTPQAAESVAKAKEFWRAKLIQLSVRINEYTAQWTHKTKVVVISSFCLVMGCMYMALLFRGINGSPDRTPDLSTSPGIARPTTPLLDDSTLAAIQRNRASQTDSTTAPMDSITK